MQWQHVQHMVARWEICSLSPEMLPYHIVASSKLHGMHVSSTPVVAWAGMLAVDWPYGFKCLPFMLSPRRKVEYIHVCTSVSTMFN